MNFQTLNKQRKFILIAAAVGIISVFLPWYTIGSGGLFGGSGFTANINGFRGIGIFVFLLLLATAGLTFTGQQTSPLEKTMWIVMLAIGAIAFLCVGIRIVSTSNSDGLGLVKPGFGIWICLLAIIAILASAWLFRNPGDTLKSGFDSLKKDLPSSQATPAPSKVDQLEKLIELKTQGKISEQEYQEMKARIV